MMPTFLTSPDASAADPNRPHVILVGLPGAGKTTVGERLAVRLGRPFLDLDREIERREGASVSDIFIRRGESAFRSLERAITAELRTCGGMVLSPGGGWIANAGTVAVLRPPARLVYMMVSPEGAIARLGKSLSSRPLLFGRDPIGHLRSLLDARATLYERHADVMIDTERFDVQELTEQIARLASSDGWV